MKKDVVLIAGLLGVAVAFALFALHEWRRTTPGEQRRVRLSESARRELEVYLGERRAIISSIPSHPMSDDILKDVSAIYRYDLGLDETEVLPLIAEHFRDSQLGLYALKSFLSRLETELGDGIEQESKIEFCRWLCEAYPSARVSCMAFDYLWKHASDRLELCNEYIEKEPDSRLSVFALMKKGHTCREAGDTARAAAYYLEAWEKDPDRAEALYKALRDIWLVHGQWIYPELIRADSLEIGELASIRERARLEIQAICEDADGAIERPQLRMWNAKGDTSILRRIVNDEAVAVRWRVEAALLLAGTLLDQRMIGDAVAVLQETWTLMTGQEKWLPEYVDFCLGVFLLPNPETIDQPRSTDDAFRRVVNRKAMSEVRKRYLELAKQMFHLVSRDEQVYYSQLVAERQLADGDVANAIATLKDAVATKGVSLSTKKGAVLALARTYVDEWSSYYEAGKLCAEFCASLDATETVPRDIRYTAGMYYFRGDLYDDALAQFEKLLAEQQEDSVRAAAEFMIGFCHLRKGDSATAIELLQGFVSRYPKSNLAARALYVEGMCHLSVQHYDDARTCFRELVDGHPQSKYAEKAKEYVERLAHLETTR